MKFHLIKLCFLCVLLVSCNTSKEIVYFQDIVVNQPEAIIGAPDLLIYVLATSMEKYQVTHWMIRGTLIFLLSEHCILPV